MKILVCIKQVPGGTELRFDAERRTLVRDAAPGVINPFDRVALALAVKLGQERGARTTVVTMGPPAAREALVEALACGVERAIHLCDPAFAGSDTLATARALAALCQREGAAEPAAPFEPFDLVLCGKHTVDGETGQVGPELAELLDLPHVSGARALTWSAAGELEVEREGDEGREWLALRLPCLLSAAEDLLPPVMARKPALDAARERPIETLGAAELGLLPERCGAAGSPTWVAALRAQPVLARPAVELLDGSQPAEVARRLAALLRDAQAQTQGAPRLALPALSAEVAGAREVLVVVERGAGGLSLASREILGEAARFAAAGSKLVVAAVVLSGEEEAGSLPEQCAACGAGRVLLAVDSALAEGSPEAGAAALAQVLEARRPLLVLFPASERGRDLAPRLAARLGLGLTGDAMALAWDEEAPAQERGVGHILALKPALGGELLAPIVSRTEPALCTLRPGVLPAPVEEPGRVAVVERLTLRGPLPARTRLLRREALADDAVERLARAQVVVGVGMGVGGAASVPAVAALAAALGGALAATRRVADSGWLPRGLQVGLTGKAIAPAVYLAIGVRGLPYHTVGVRRAGTIIAINKDERAPIFQLARYGVVGDWAQIVPALTAALQTE